MLQRERDRAAGLNTAGYRLGLPRLAARRPRYRAARGRALSSPRTTCASSPGVNEDLAATAIWGTQQLHLLPGAKRDGIFAMWYGKGPGVDRCGDVFKHANHAGTSRAGGVLVVAGDDHAARSSAVAHQSEHIFSACAIPVLAPAGVQDILDFGLHGWAMSRYTGLLGRAQAERRHRREFGDGGDRCDARAGHDCPTISSCRPMACTSAGPTRSRRRNTGCRPTKIYAAAAYARANGLDRLVWDSPRSRASVSSPAARPGSTCARPCTIWASTSPRPRRSACASTRSACRGRSRPTARGVSPPDCEEILVVEEKRQIIEYQLKEMLYNWREDVRPRVVGKFDEAGEWPAPLGHWLLPPTGELTPAIVARAIASRLARLDAKGQWAERGAGAGPGAQFRHRACSCSARRTSARAVRTTARRACRRAPAPSVASAAT